MRSRRKSDDVGAIARGRGAPLKWDDERIESELRTLMAEWGCWPRVQMLRQRGYAALASAVIRSGGGQHWAKRLGTEQPPGSGERYWSDARIEAALRDFLVGRSDWPTTRDFSAAGLRGLHSAICRYGGAARWAEHFGLPVRRRGEH
jgi:hypothetical protein